MIVWAQLESGKYQGQTSDSERTVTIEEYTEMRTKGKSARPRVSPENCEKVPEGTKWQSVKTVKPEET